MFWRKHSSRQQRNDRSCGVENGGGEADSERAAGNFGGRGDGTVPCLGGGGDYTTRYVCRNSQNQTLKRVSFTVRKLYGNKPDFSRKCSNVSLALGPLGLGDGEARL